MKYYDLCILCPYSRPVSWHFFVKRLWPIGLFGLVYAAFLPFFGMNQMYWLVGSLHWLIQIAHLLVGIGATALIYIVTSRFERSYKATRAVVAG
jgi:hypothetical protein